MTSNNLNDQEQSRREKLAALESSGINPYPYSYDINTSADNILKQFDDENPDALGNVSIAGRVMSYRKMGKAAFMHLQDQSGKIQAYLKKDDSPDFFGQLENLDLGDILGISGTVFRTKTGEITVKILSASYLCKALAPLPVVKEEIDENGNKIIHDAFKDKELRYRRRYVDLIVNSDVKETFIKRSKIIAKMRDFFNQKGWLEVETPVLQPLYGGASARPFITKHNALGVDLYMRIALELYLKRLIVGGFEGVYEISKNFRNEGMDKTHNPEFTMMEIYVAYKDYNWMMDMTEELLKTIAQSVNNKYKVSVDGVEIDLEPSFARIPMFDLYKQYTGEDLRGASKEKLISVAKAHKIHLEAGYSEMKILDEIFSELVEPNLIQPTFVIDYPLAMSPLAKKHRTEEGLVERFELYVNGAEMANAFSELNDPRDQRERFEEQARNKAAGDDEAMIVDEDFLYSLEVGMPPTAGLGIGIDRLVMLLTGKTSIRDVLFFPQMRPEKTV